MSNRKRYNKKPPILNGKRYQGIYNKYLHHEVRNNPKIEPDIPEGGGYFGIHHKNCLKGDKPFMKLVFMYIDRGTFSNNGHFNARVVLVYQCYECKKQQVIKDLIENIAIDLHGHLISLLTSEKINYKKYQEDFKRWE